MGSTGPAAAAVVLCALLLCLAAPAGSAVALRRPRPSWMAALMGPEDSDDIESETGPVDRPATEPLPELTEWGRSVKRFVFAPTGSGFCASGNDDWRGDLPRYLVRFLPQARNIFIPIHKKHGCWRCRDNFKNSGDRARLRSCGKMLGTNAGNRTKADLVIVLASGTGIRGFTSIKRALSKSRIGPNTVTVHFPIRRLASLSASVNVMNFTKVIDDNTFLKPLARTSANTLEQECTLTAGQREKDLLYIGRLKETKGQLEFLNRIDPKLLWGYTVHFYGSGDRVDPRPLMAEMRRVADLRGISVMVHGRVPKARVLRHLCKASGVVHFAESDVNPRVAYEGLYAGIPLFITKKSDIPEELLGQPFVVGTDWDRDVSVDFKQFRSILTTDWRQDGRWQRFVQTTLSPVGVYTKICRDIGLCAPGGDGASLTASPLGRYDSL